MPDTPHNSLKDGSELSMVDWAVANRQWIIDFSRKNGLTRSDAEDVAQQVILSTLVRLNNNPTPPDSVWAYCMAIVRSEIHRIWMKSARRNECEYRPELDLVSRSLDMDVDFASLSLLKSRMSGLPERSLATLTGRWNGLSEEEIGKKFGTSAATVSRDFHSALAQLEFRPERNIFIELGSTESMFISVKINNSPVKVDRDTFLLLAEICSHAISSPGQFLDLRNKTKDPKQALRALRTCLKGAIPDISDRLIQLEERYFIRLMVLPENIVQQ